DQALGEIKRISACWRYCRKISLREKARHLGPLTKIMHWPPLSRRHAAEQRKYGLLSIVCLKLLGPGFLWPQQFPHMEDPLAIGPVEIVLIPGGMLRPLQLALGIGIFPPEISVHDLEQCLALVDCYSFSDHGSEMDRRLGHSRSGGGRERFQILDQTP